MIIFVIKGEDGNIALEAGTVDVVLGAPAADFADGTAPASDDAPAQITQVKEVEPQGGRGRGQPPQQDLLSIIREIHSNFDAQIGCAGAPPFVRFSMVARLAKKFRGERTAAVPVASRVMGCPAWCVI